MKTAAHRLGTFPVLILLLACGGASTASSTGSNSGSAVTKETLVWSD